MILYARWISLPLRLLPKHQRGEFFERERERERMPALLDALQRPWRDAKLAGRHAQ